MSHTNLKFAINFFTKMIRNQPFLQSFKNIFILFDVLPGSRENYGDEVACRHSHQHSVGGRFHTRSERDCDISHSECWG